MDWRALARAGLWSVGFLLLAYLIAALLAVVVAVLVAPAGTGAEAGAAAWLASPGPGAALVIALSTLVGALAATYLVGVRRFRWSGARLRWTAVGRPLRGLGVGLLYGIVPAIGVLMASAALGHARWIPGHGSIGASALSAGGLVLVLAPAALAEEVLFRGVPLVALGDVVGPGTAVTVLAAVFGLAHLPNPNVTGLAVANVALAGVLLGTLFYGSGGIWTAFGAHLGWNLCLAASGAVVSGIPFDIPWLAYHGGGPQWLTGGSFGPEGGLLATIMIALAVVVAARRARRNTA